MPFVSLFLLTKIIYGCLLDKSEHPLVIGKSRKPHCFKGVKKLPMTYNKTAWMTSTIFDQWLLEWDANLKKEGKRAVLLVDNCAAHEPLPELSKLRVEFLPANTTSIL